MKRKRFDRRGWVGIKEIDYKELRIDEDDFHGIAALIKFKEVTQPTFWGQMRVIDKGQSWLGICEDGKNTFITAMCDKKGDIIHWYIDIIDRVEFDEDGVRLFYDLYLDMQISIDGRRETYDRDELDAALQSGDINETQYNKANDALNRLIIDTEDYNSFKSKCEKIYKIANKS